MPGCLAHPPAGIDLLYADRPKDAAVNLRYGGALREQVTPPLKEDAIKDVIQKDALVLQKLANAVGGRSCPPIRMERV